MAAVSRSNASSPSASLGLGLKVQIRLPETGVKKGKGAAMVVQDEGNSKGQPINAYHLTLTGVADDMVREELRRYYCYETADDLTFRVSGPDLLDLRLALAERLGEDQGHPSGAWWTEQQVYAHAPAGVTSRGGARS